MIFVNASCERKTRIQRRCFVFYCTFLIFVLCIVFPYLVYYNETSREIYKQSCDKTSNLAVCPYCGAKSTVFEQDRKLFEQFADHYIKMTAALKYPNHEMEKELKNYVPQVENAVVGILP